METEQKEAYNKARDREIFLKEHLHWQNRQLARLDLADSGYECRLRLVQHYSEQLRLATIKRVQLHYQLQTA